MKSICTVKKNPKKRGNGRTGGSGDRDAALREEIARTVKEIMMKTKKQEE